MTALGNGHLARPERGSRLRAGGAAVVTAVLLVAACGSGAIEGPEPSSSRALPTTSTSSSAGPTATSSRTPSSGATAVKKSGSTSPVEDVGYSYSLPVGDFETSEQINVVYGHLYNGDCSGAQTTLDYGWWRDFSGPEEVLLIQVSVYMCRNQRSRANALSDRAVDLTGWGGIAKDTNDCRMYMAYLHARGIAPGGKRYPPCIDGEARLAGWPNGAFRGIDDPRTPEVEKPVLRRDDPWLILFSGAQNLSEDADIDLETGSRSGKYVDVHWNEATGALNPVGGAVIVVLGTMDDVNLDDLGPDRLRSACASSTAGAPAEVTVPATPPAVVLAVRTVEGNYAGVAADRESLLWTTVKG